MRVLCRGIENKSTTSSVELYISAFLSPFSIYPGGTATATFYACQIILKTRQVVVVVSAWVIYFILSLSLSLSFFFWSLLCSHYVLLDDPLLYTVYYSSSVLAERRLVTLFSSRRFASAMRQAYAYIPPYTQQCLGLTFDLYIYVQAALPGSAGTHRGVATTIFLFSCFMTQSEQNNRGRKGSQYRDNR